MKALTTIFVLSVLLLVGGCGHEVQKQLRSSDKDFHGSVQWETYKWAGTSPLELTVDTRNIGSVDWFMATKWAAMRWEDDLDGKVKFKFVTNDWADHNSADIGVESGDYGKTDWVGLASPTIENGRFTHVELDFNTPYATTPGEMVSTACHELGHAMGLGHSEGIESCMHETVGYQEPAKTDIEVLEKIYESETV